MQIIRPSSEAEMIYEFLKMEFTSDRYRDKIEAVLSELNTDKYIITDGNIESVEENAIRAEILKRFRGWPDKEIFENFPNSVQWVWAEFNTDDITKIKYIEYSYWNELSDYTGSPLIAAKTIMSGRTVFDVSNDNALKGTTMIKGGYRFPPMIFLTGKNEDCFYILEGHGRMTVYGLMPDLFQNVPVILGYCKHNALKEWYGKMPEPPREYSTEHLFFARM